MITRYPSDVIRAKDPSGSNVDISANSSNELSVEDKDLRSLLYEILEELKTINLHLANMDEEL